MRSEKGIVAAAEPEAAKVGRDILSAGGNAIDAAVAVGFALAVTYPAAGNLGGGGFLVGSIGREKETSETPQENLSSVALDFREVAPLQSTSDMYVKAKESSSLLGHLASGVPGSVDGLLHALDSWGSMSRDQVLAPAIRLAKDGFPMTQRTHSMLARKSTMNAMLKYRAPADLFYPGGKPVPTGTLFKQPDLARTLDLIRQKGREGFYSGDVADHLATEMKRGGGLISLKDLKEYRSVERTPIKFPTSDGFAISMPPPSSGGICLAQISSLLEGYPFSTTEAGSARHLHLLAEAMRRSFADRNQFLGDPDFVDCQTQLLLSTDHLNKLRSSISEDVATPSSNFTSSPQGVKESEQTTHYSIVDPAGNGVAVTTTLNGSFGSKVVVPGTGFLLNNEMDDFTTRPGVPNLFGLIQGELNGIAPGKRPLSSMSPTVWHYSDGSVRGVLGTPGGPTIITNVFQVLFALDRLGLSPELAVSMPKMHHQCLPDQIYVEQGHSESVLQQLKALKHKIVTRSNIGDFQLITHLNSRGWTGISDPRGGGASF